MIKAEELALELRHCVENFEDGWGLNVAIATDCIERAFAAELAALAALKASHADEIAKVRHQNNRDDEWMDILRLKAETAEAELVTLKASHERLHDLVRYKRSELHTDGLISDDEYAELLTAQPGAVKRLEGYDAAIEKLKTSHADEIALALVDAIKVCAEIIKVRANKWRSCTVGITHGPEYQRHAIDLDSLYVHILATIPADILARVDTLKASQQAEIEAWKKRAYDAARSIAALNAAHLAELALNQHVALALAAIITQCATHTPAQSAMFTCEACGFRGNGEEWKKHIVDALTDYVNA